MSESGTELGANDGKFGGAAFAEGASISSRSVQERGARRGLSRIEPWAVAVLILLSLPIAFYGLAFPFAPEANPDFYVRLMSMPWYAHLHFLGSAVALLLGGFQFSARLRGALPAVHRWLGRIYLLAVLAGGIGGLGLATISHGGPPTHVAFMLLAVLWLYSGAQAYRAIRAGAVAEHRRWMIRNFALTFAAVTLRIELGLTTGLLGWTFDDAYLTVAWLSWVPNLVVAEWWILRRRSGTAVGAAAT